MPLTTVALLTLVGLVALFVVFQTYSLSLYKRRFRMMEAKYAQLATAARSRSPSAQRAVLKGQIAEQMAPLLPGFKYQPADYRAVGGQPIDFMVFRGLSLAMEGLGDIEEVVIGDIKMGGSKLSRHQQLIKRAVEQGRVRWETIHIDQDFLVRSK